MAPVQNALSLCFLLSFLISVSAYPTFYMIRSLLQMQHPQNAPQSSAGVSSLPRPKRAFDRLDASPFDFDTLSKRFNDNEDENQLLSAISLDAPFVSSPYIFKALRKRSFDRLENGAFFWPTKTDIWPNGERKR
ncbi:hypothetical protein niasHT_010809 [Heterodera trifolii]|uniref:Uncharacterized protein n=1 Tax=Heterodera trifolii TaxID=157864 RepID=A0ABD2KVP2_9BILA